MILLIAEAEFPGIVGYIDFGVALFRLIVAIP